MGLSHKLPSSSVTGYVPPAGTFREDEILINYADGVLYVHKNVAGVPVVTTVSGGSGGGATGPTGPSGATGPTGTAGPTGAAGAGSGALATVTSLGTALSIVGGVLTLSGITYGQLPTQVRSLPLICSIPGAPGAAVQLWTIPLIVPITIAAALSGSYAIAGVAATASSVFTLAYTRSGVTTTIGTITFAAAGTVGTLASSAYTSQANDILTLTAPSPADLTLANIGISILALRV